MSGADMSTDEVKLIKASMIVDGLGKDPYKHSAIVTQGKRIVWIGSEKAYRGRKPDKIIDLSGFTILPGLIDCHLHTSFDGEPNYYDIVLKQSTPYRTLKSLHNALKDLNAGFTTIRVMGEKSHLDIALRDAIQEGIIRGPRIIAAGQNITVTGGHADLWLAPEIRYEEGLGGIIVNGPQAFREAVRAQVKHGADLIKLVVTGGIMSAGGDPGRPYISKEEITAAVDEAHFLGRKVAAHCHGAGGARIAVEAGCDSIEHGTFLIKDPEVIEMMAEKGVFLVPTLATTVAHHPDSRLLPDFYVRKSMEAKEYAQKSLQYAFSAGVRIATGTDAGSPGNRHGNNAIELELLVRAGMPEMNAILSATKVSSECVGLEESVGTLEVDKLADIIAVKGDPRSDISLLRDVKFVMKEGTIYKNEGQDLLPDLIGAPKDFSR
jgi:imidazolonepropionase-like amidohydrolase